MIISRDSNPNSDEQQQPIGIPIPFLRQQQPFGDLVAAITASMGARPCSPCAQRQQALNRMLVFRPWGQS